MPLTTQEIYNRVAKHLLAQGGRSQSRDDDGDLVCAYRGANHTSCAVGCLIPDEVYTPDIEGGSVTAIAVLEVLVKADVLAAGVLSLPRYNGGGSREGISRDDAPLEVTLLDLLQRMHDNDEAVHWREELQRISRGLNLDATVLEN